MAAKRTSRKTTEGEAGRHTWTLPDRTRAALLAAVDAIRGVPRAPIGLGYLLEQYLDEPIDVGLDVGERLLLRLRAATHAKGRDDERGDVIRELVGGADRLLYRADRIVAGDPVPDDDELRRLRIPNQYGSTDRQRLDTEAFVRFAHMAALLVKSARRGLAEDVDIDIETNHGLAREELPRRLRRKVTPELVKRAADAWTKRGRPRGETRPIGKWEALRQVAADLGLHVSESTLEDVTAKMRATNLEALRRRAALKAPTRKTEK